MAFHLIFLAPIFLHLLLLPPILAESDNSHPLPNFAFSWLDDKDTYVAGDIMILQVKVLGNYERDNYNYPFNPNISVNGKMGNSSIISGLSSHFDGDPNTWTISLVPIMVGLFNVLLTDVHFKVLDSSLHFNVNPGIIYPPACVVSWMNEINEFVAGNKGTVLVLPKDAFGNNASSSNQGPVPFNLTVYASYVNNGSFATEFGSALVGWNPSGLISIEFQVLSSGNFFLSVEDRNQSLNGSPLPFKVNPGLLDMKNCVAKWKSDTQYFQLFSVMETFLHQRDQYGNLVLGFYDFDIEVFEKDTNLSMPISDLNSKEIVPGIMLFSFGLTEPGNFKLMISDNEQKNFISNMPFEFTVFIGYCDGRNSFANGSGLNDSVAGEASIFSVVLRDSYQYPSPIKLEYLQVDIVHESGIHIKPVIFQIDTNWNSSSNMFEIVHTPEKSGLYAISVICGNIPLNGGHPFTKRVLAGDVDISLSGVVNFSSKVPKMIKNEIVVQLMDSFSNPILLQQPKLKLEISSINKSDFSSWNFSNSYDGMYTSSYLLMEVGTYEICASLDGQHLLSCPFSVNAYNGEYFPKAYDDEIYVLEDESIAFNVLDNDYLAGSNASIIHFSKPTRGSLLQYGLQYRYTPYRGYVGNDSFSYVVSDANGNLANGSVNISVFSIPPQLISFPSQLQATEDEITPKFSGFQGFEIMYSDLTKKISITLTAHHGIVSLSPILVQFWKTMWDELYLMNNGDGDSKELTIMGRLEVVNYALQSVQYLGKENFWGDDVIHVSTSDGNGVNDVDIPIFVEPINDPPFINVPKFIILKKRSSSNEDGYLIFEREKDNFNFSVGDPDLLYFLGNKSEFLVMFSLEVDSGVVSTNLPADLISSTELKLKGSYQWQSLQTFVTISRHFTVKARGIRFLGTVDDCNSIMQDLSYYQSEEEGNGGGAMLTVKINDMGNYGCQTSFCQVNMSGPLFAHADIHLIRSKPMSPFAAHSLGSAIVIGSIMVLTLGVVLLYFICKCSFLLLINGRKRRTNLDIQPIASSNSPPPSPSPPTTTTAGTITKLQPTPFQQRLQGQLRNGEGSSSSSKGGNQSFL